MKKTLLIATAILLSSGLYAQTKNFWTKTSPPSEDKRISSSRLSSASPLFYDLDADALQKELSQARERGNASRTADIVVSFPNASGKFENFAVVQASVLHPELAAKYPGIFSYAGQSIDDPTATIRFSLSQQKGLHAMIISSEEGTAYIDPYTSDKKTYVVYKRSDLVKEIKDFECLTDEQERTLHTRENTSGRTNDKKLRKYRLALSCNAEYGNLFAGTGTTAQKKANILAQMNITMTRVNGIYELDLAITLQLVPNNDLIIYLGSTTADPWSGEFNNKTQQVTDNVIGNANYDIGHNFNTSGGGNAGCIGCVCVSGSKGSGYTGRSNPTGDAFDIDYVAHEMGHQFGGYHTQSNASCISGDGTTEVEPGSGSTIMGYAGICAANVQSSSDAYFHYVNIRDISANIQTGASAGCAEIINISNNPPSANAGNDYTIPKSTAFVLKGQGSDADGDALTYTWEQIDPENESTTSNDAPTATKTTGPMFRSRQGTTSPVRYFPQMSDVVSGNLTPTWEVIPSVGRTLNFALTVRDNKTGGGQTSDDVMRVTVHGSAGPFTVSAPNTATTWAVSSSQTVTWNVATTNVAPVNCQNVNILLSTDGGFTYPVTLLSNTPNDGSQSIVVPNNVSSSCRIKVEAVGNIFYDISNTNFLIAASVACTATVPTGLSASTVASTSATLSWNAVTGATYDVQYRKTGTSTWTTVAASTPSIVLNGLTAQTEYEAKVRSKCTSSSSAYSAVVKFTTTNTTLTYCASKGNSVADEYIESIQIGSINHVSGANSGYGNYTNLSTDLAKGATATLIITPAWTGTAYNEGYNAWIDFNKDGDFTDTGEQVLNRSVTKATPITASFTIPSTAALGATRMRVTMKYNATATACETFDYGEVEDYTINIISESIATCTNVALTLKLDNYPEETSWSIKNESGTVVASGGPYSSSPDGSTISSVNCLPTGCYTFTINDAYNDGICCNFGDGSYTLKNDAGTVLASGSTFTTSQSHNVCVGGATRNSRGEENSSLRAEEKSYRFIYPNPVSNELNINIGVDIMVKSLRIVSTNGVVMKDFINNERTIDTSSLPAGVYILSIESQKGLIHEKFIKQ